ncbi:MAG: monovalent cation/H+ antiporter subunit D family protein, partial [Chloroflexi bacterium]|nr:monovalent cation/H+ antiporter subunit D family protein [Chloroflexota bacterium]
MPAYAVAIPLVVALAVAASGRWPNVRDAWPVAGAAILLAAVFSMLGDVTGGEPPTATLLEVSPGIELVL